MNDSRGELHSLSVDSLIEQMNDKADQREAGIETETRQQTIARIEENYYDHEIVSETVPYDKEAWQIFRDEIIKYLEGQHADYLRVGQIFIESAAKYVELDVRCEIRERNE